MTRALKGLLACLIAIVAASPACTSDRGVASATKAAQDRAVSPATKAPPPRGDLVRVATFPTPDDMAEESLVALGGVYGFAPLTVGNAGTTLVSVPVSQEAFVRDLLRR